MKLNFISVHSLYGVLTASAVAAIAIGFPVTAIAASVIEGVVQYAPSVRTDRVTVEPTLADFILDVQTANGVPGEKEEEHNPPKPSPPGGSR